MGNQQTLPETWEEKVERKYQYYWYLFDGGSIGPHGPIVDFDTDNWKYWKKEHDKLEEEKKLRSKKEELEKQNEENEKLDKELEQARNKINDPSLSEEERAQ